MRGFVPAQPVSCIEAAIGPAGRTAALTSVMSGSQGLKTVKRSSMEPGEREEEEKEMD